MAQMVKKAKFLYKCQGVLWYEYRGHTYLVNPQLWTSTAAQHRNEQNHIDAEIEREEKAKKNEGKPIDWDEIWKMLDWN